MEWKAVFQPAVGSPNSKPISPTGRPPGSKLITLSDSSHGIVYDHLEKFDSLFMDSIAD